jgi:hypothetical protein
MGNGKERRERKRRDKHPYTLLHPYDHEKSNIASIDY